MRFLQIIILATASNRVVSASFLADPTAHGIVNDWKSTYETSKLPGVNATLLSQTIKKENLLSKGSKLESFAALSKNNTRVIGSEGHNATVRWLNESLSRFSDYYDVSLQDLAVGPVPAKIDLRMMEKTYEATGFMFSPGGSINASLTYVPYYGCYASYFENVTGRIVLTSRGGCDYGTKSALSGAAGASGLIVYNIGQDSMEGHSLGNFAHPNGPYIPTISINEPDGQKLRKMLEEGHEIPTILNLETKMIHTYNVIAQTKLGDPDNVVHVGAHSDSVAAGPGMNDNGSGTIALLEVAEQLVKFKVMNAVRFSWWAAEEQGLIGSTYYVNNLTDAEISKIRLYLNFDMLASPNYIIGIYDGAANLPGAVPGPPGSAEAQSLFAYFYLMSSEHSVDYSLNGHSDYRAFLLAGIPIGGITTGAKGNKTNLEWLHFWGKWNQPYDPNYHTARDDLANCNQKAWKLNTEAAAYAIGTWGESWEYFPKRNGTLETKSGNVGIWRAEEGMVGPVHVM